MTEGKKLDTLYSLALDVGLKLEQKGQRLVTAESCTGGLLAEVLTRVPGSSNWFERGFVTYSLTSKIELLGVSESELSENGAVSEPIVKQMAVGALAKSCANWAIATSGIAGPDGGTAKTPVGFVWVAIATLHAVFAQPFQFAGNRIQIRQEAAKAALQALIMKI